MGVLKGELAASGVSVNLVCPGIKMHPPLSIICDFGESSGGISGSGDASELGARGSADRIKATSTCSRFSSSARFKSATPPGGTGWKALKTGNFPSSC